MQYIIILSLLIPGFFILYFLLKKKIEKAVSPQKLIEEIRIEIDRIILGLNNTTERNIGLIEDKLEELNKLLKIADKRIMLLNKENDKQDLRSRDYRDILTKAKKKETDRRPKDSNDASVRERVLKLHREGFTPRVIANNINLPVGEIELIISLEQGKE